MSAKKTVAATSNAQSESPVLQIVKTFAASRDLLWRAWTDPVMLRKWSCPTGFSIEFDEGDVKVGGKWRSGMRAPDGVLHVAAGTYREISKPSRLVFTHGWENEKGVVNHETLVEIDFEEKQGKAVMTFVQSGFKSVESRDGHEGGWSEAFIKLEQLANAKA